MYRYWEIHGARRLDTTQKTERLQGSGRFFLGGGILLGLFTDMYGVHIGYRVHAYTLLVGWYWLLDDAIQRSNEGGGKR
jgi:hypothetical protein